MLSIACIFVDKTSALKFKSSRGDPVYFLPHKTTSNKLELQRTSIYLIKHIIAILKTITTNGYWMSVWWQGNTPWWRDRLHFSRRLDGGEETGYFWRARVTQGLILSRGRGNSPDQMLIMRACSQTSVISFAVDVCSRHALHRSRSAAPVSQRSWVQDPYGPDFNFNFFNFLIFFLILIFSTSSIVFIAARIFYICFFTAVHINDFHMSIIMSVIALFSSFFMTLTNQGLVGYYRFAIKCKETH